ncbi:MAG: tetratricopeptide repeat protein, partial [Planctomycetota bacterium]|nr:tetratricopeptide repeat protein [Planctomycetota bacterium]
MLVRFPKRARQDALLNKRPCLGVDHWLGYLLRDESEATREHWALDPDLSAETPAKLGDYKLSAGLLEILGRCHKVASEDKVAWLENDHALSASFAALGKKDLPEGSPKLSKEHPCEAAAIFFRARALFLVNPSEALKLLTDQSKALQELSKLFPVNDLKGGLLARTAFLGGQRDTKKISKDLDQALSAYKEAVKLESTDIGTLQLERERLFHQLVRGQAKQASKDIDRLQPAFEEHLTWEQSAEERGRIELVKDQSGSDKGRILWLGARVHWQLMREWSRRYDDEEAESTHADGFWNRAVEARKEAEKLCVEAAEIDKKSAWPLYQLSQLRSYNEDLLLLGAGFPKKEVLDFLDQAIERQGKAWILHQEKARVLLRDPEIGDLVELLSDDANSALKSFQKVVELGEALGALQGGGVALDRASRQEGSERDESLKIAVELFETLKQLRKNNVDAYRGLAFAHLEQEQSEAALNIALEGLTVLPDNVDLKVLAARIYVEEKREEEAKKLIDEILAVDPENPEALLLGAYDSFGESDG